MGSTPRALSTRLTHTLRRVAAAVRRKAQMLRYDDRGSQSVEYAIGIGLGAAIVLALYAAYRNGVAGVINSWVFK